MPLRPCPAAAWTSDYLNARPLAALARGFLYAAALFRPAVACLNYPQPIDFNVRQEKAAVEPKAAARIFKDARKSNSSGPAGEQEISCRWALKSSTDAGGAALRFQTVGRPKAPFCPHLPDQRAIVDVVAKRGFDI
jgi:hypothetical protein